VLVRSWRESILAACEKGDGMGKDTKWAREILSLQDDEGKDVSPISYKGIYAAKKGGFLWLELFIDNKSMMVITGNAVPCPYK